MRCDLRAWGVAWRRVRDLGSEGVEQRAVSADISAGVEYRLVRNAVVREVERGRTQKIDVCDAHPELLRAARNVGKPDQGDLPHLHRDRPGHGDLRLRGQAPGRGPVPGHGGRTQPAVPAPEPVLCFEVEVCPECAWHHLMRKYPAGGPKGVGTGRWPSERRRRPNPDSGRLSRQHAAPVAPRPSPSPRCAPGSGATAPPPSSW